MIKGWKKRIRLSGRYSRSIRRSRHKKALMKFMSKGGVPKQFKWI